MLVVNSSELRAVQGHQKNDFVLRAINPPKQRKKHGRSKKRTREERDDEPAVDYGLRQKWGLDPEIDFDTRRVCEGT